MLKTMQKQGHFLLYLRLNIREYAKYTNMTQNCRKG